MARNSDMTTTAVAAFLVGGIVGAGLALLFAPQSGRQTRRKITDMAEDVREHVTEYAERIKDRIEEIKDEAAEYTERLKEKIT